MADLLAVQNFICILQKCRKKKDLALAKQVHAHICNNGLEAHRAVGNYIVPTFVECGSLSDAQQVFNRLVNRNEHSWTALMLGYIQCGQPQHALNLYKKMQEDHVHPSSFTLVTLLKACAILKDMERGREIHIEISQEGFEEDLVVGNTLVSIYAKCGWLSEAGDVFDKLLVRDIVSWNVLIAGYAEHGPDQEVLKCIEQMQLEGIFPDSVTFVSALKACGGIGAVDKGQVIHMEIIQMGLERSPFVGNTLVDMYAKSGSFSEAQEVFNKLPVRDVVSWNAIIAKYADCESVQAALNCFKKMQLEGVPPNAVTFVCLLKVCCSMGGIDKGRELHVEIIQKGIEGDLFVGSTLVSMYANCDSLPDAQKVFDKLPIQEVVSWTALIAGYAEHGPWQEALKCFEHMQLQGIPPNAVTLVCILKACGSIGALDKGRETHTEIIQKGLERDCVVSSTLVGMYAKCGSLQEAQDLFDKLPVRDVVSWNVLIAGYVEHGPGQEALKCFEHMQLEGVCPNAVTFVCVLKACGSIGVLDKGRKIHMEITQKGFEGDPLIGSTLIDMFAKCGSLSEAWDVFDKLSAQDIVSWMVLIAGFYEHGSGEEALDCLEQMQAEGLSPNAVTFFCTLKACGNIGALGKGREIHMKLTQKGFERDLFLGSTLVDMYAKCGSLSEAQEIFDKLPIRDVVSWNAAIAGYVEHALGQEALKCFEEMQLEGIFPDSVTFACILKACGSVGAIHKGREIHMEIIQKGFERDPFVGGSLVDMYAKCGSLSESQEVFTKLPVQEVVPWTALIAGYAEHGLGQEAVTCFEQAQLEHISPNTVTFVCVLKACGTIGAIDKGRKIHTEITQKGLERNLFVGNTLVDMYAKCGELLEAQEMFGMLPVRDVVSWNALIAGYAISCEEHLALQCFEDMQKQGVKANAVTFTCLLTACSHASLVCKGQEYFKVMREEYGISPTVDHCTCMVDLLARSGHLKEAEKFLETMPCPLSEGMWKALLSGCKMYGEEGLGLRCFQQLVRLNPKHSSSYVLMAGIYASAGRWEDGYRIEELRNHAGAIKKLASALIEVNKKVHEFVVGNNQSNEISARLEILSLRMKKEGHVPNLDLVLSSIPNEEKGAAS